MDIQIIVLADPRGRLFPDDLDPAEVVVDPETTPILHWVDDHPPYGSGWELLFRFDDDDGLERYFIPGRLVDLDRAVELACYYLSDPPDWIEWSLRAEPRRSPSRTPQL